MSLLYTCLRGMVKHNASLSPYFAFKVLLYEMPKYCINVIGCHGLYCKEDTNVNSEEYPPNEQGTHLDPTYGQECLGNI